MSKPDLFLVFFPVGYLNNIHVPEKNVLKDPLYLGEFMSWFGCWLYTACCFGIPERGDWWSFTPPVMYRGAPFCFN